jgi:hypothetical protein
MSKRTRKRRPEILKPGLKMLTPIELRTVAAHNHANALRWKHLFSLNVWKPIK